MIYLFDPQQVSATVTRHVKRWGYFSLPAIILAVVVFYLGLTPAWAVGGAPTTTVEGGNYTSLDVAMLIFYVSMALVFSFTCSIAESVLLSITPSYIADLKDSNPKRAAALKELKQDKIDQSLAAILTLNTIAHTVGSIGAGAKATVVFGSAWFGVFSAVITLLILVFTEIIPKTLGATYWRKIAGIVAVYVKGLIFILYPLIWLSEKLTKMLVSDKSEHAFSRREFAALASVGEESGLINPLESQIIRNLLALGAIYTKDIMTPRSVILAMPKSMKVGELLQQRPNLSLSRIPIYDNDIDDVKGFVLKSDMLLAKANGEADRVLADFEREITFVFTKMKLFDLLDMMLKERIQIVMVSGEYGETRGLITLEDVIETLLGLEIVDEVDRVEDMQKLAKEMMRKRAERLGYTLGHNVKDIDTEEQESSHQETYGVKDSSS